MTARRLIAALALAASAALPARAAPPEEWLWRPSLYVFGSVESSTRLSSRLLDPSLSEPSPALSLAAALDASRQWNRAGFEGALMGLARSPFADARNYLLAGRVHAFRQVGQGWRLTLDDTGKLQRRAEASLSDVQRNQALLTAEWQGGQGPTLRLQLEDRRRTVPRQRSLGYALQGVGLAAAFAAGTGIQVQAEVNLQRYSALTASGRRLKLAAEAVRIHRRGAAALRYELFEPLADRVLFPVAPSPSPAPAPATLLTSADQALGALNRGAPFETLALERHIQETALAAVEEELVADRLLLDPVATEHDEWDFGRRKHVVSAYASQRVGQRLRLSVHALYERRRGPDLLALAGVGERSDEKIELRATAHCRLTRRLTLLLLGAHAQFDDAERGGQNVRRTLAVFGLQLH